MNDARAERIAAAIEANTEAVREQKETIGTLIDLVDEFIDEFINTGLLIRQADGEVLYVCEPN